MACGKKSANAPTEEFILESPAPVDVSAKLSAIYRELSLKVNNCRKKYDDTFRYLIKDASSKGVLKQGRNMIRDKLYVHMFEDGTYMYQP